MKKSSLINVIAGLLSLAGSALAGTLTITGNITFTPPEVFTNNTITAEIISNLPGVTGDVLRISGGSTILPPTTNPAEADVNGTFTTTLNDKLSLAYSFTVNSASVNPVTYTVGGTITIPPLPPQNFSDTGTINSGLNLYSNVIDTGIPLVAGISGTFTGSLMLDFSGGTAPIGALDVEIQQIDIQLADTAATLPPPSQSLNISTRGDVETGDDVLIGGFIITGTQDKQVIIRALGPSLGLSGVTGVLTDPVLELHDSSGAIIATNDNWKDNSADDQATIIANGLDMYNNGTTSTEITDSEAVLVATLTPDPLGYTAIVTGANGGTGVGLVEVYDVDTTTDGQLGNISTRGLVGTVDNTLIGGFIIGPDTDGASSIIVRALGPSLAAKGITDPLADPTLTVMDANANVVATNDNFVDSPDNATITADGLAPDDPETESAVLVIPQAGEYTALVTGVNATTGVGLVEVYNLAAQSSAPPQ